MVETQYHRDTKHLFDDEYVDKHVIIAQSFA